MSERRRILWRKRLRRGLCRWLALRLNSWICYIGIDCYAIRLCGLFTRLILYLCAQVFWSQTKKRVKFE